MNNFLSLIEACIKSQLAPILDPLFFLPTNSPRAMKFLQGVEKSGSSKYGGEYKDKVVGKVFQLRHLFQFSLIQCI